jgi:tetratricopeptide (TPR) repeat protein
LSLETERLNALAQAIVDGASIDWDGLHASGSTVDGVLLNDLRALSAVAERDAELRPGDTWGGLVLQEEVGRGTYGVVYRAWDPSLEREVALKIFRATEAARGGAERAVREGRLLAKVRHPNVVTVYGADEHGGRLGLWTEFVKGKTLRDVLAEQGPMAAEEAARVGTDLCHALAAMHAAGIVHGDIKAQNVMREMGGRIVLMDFGAGELVDAALRRPVLVGTPAYLAPEVLAGGAATAASDIYALGVLLFVLASGTFPHDASSITGLRTAVAAGRRRYLRDVRPDLPPWFVEAIDAALSGSPTARPTSAGAFDAALRRTRPRSSATRRTALALMIGTTVVALGALVAFWPRPAAGPVPPPELVLNADGDEAQPLLALIRATLANSRSITVGERARNSAMQRRLSPSGERGARSFRASVIDGAGRTLWTDVFSERVADAVHSEKQIARAVAVAVLARVAPEDWARTLASAHGYIEAASTFVSARAHLSLRSAPEMNLSLALASQAIQKRPDFAAAHASLAETYALLGVYRHVGRRDYLLKSLEAGARATSLEPDLAEGHAALAYTRSLAGDLTAAEIGFKRALDLRPVLTDAHIRLSTVYVVQGRFDEAFAELKTARALDPTSLPARSQLGSALLLARRYDEAIREARSFITDFPGLPSGYQTLGAALCYAGDCAAGAIEIRRGVDAEGSGMANSYLLGTLGLAEARAGHRSEAARILSILKRRVAEGTSGAAVDVAAVEAALGRVDDALRSLRQAVANDDDEVQYLAITPRWDGLRSVPAFQELARSGRQGH